jgi:hypothetical protein
VGGPAVGRASKTARRTAADDSAPSIRPRVGRGKGCRTSRAGLSSAALISARAEFVAAELCAPTGR